MRDAAELAVLARRLVDLEERAYEEFALLFGPQLLRYFTRHGLPRFEAEDLAATCVTDLALKADKYRPDAGNFSAWVFAIARRRMADHFSKTRRTADAIREIDWAGPDNFYSNEAVAVEVSAALAELSETDRILVQRRAMGKEHGYQELALELGISVGAARVRHLRAMERLEARLAATPVIQSKLKGQKK